jgi:hypothetical protein
MKVAAGATMATVWAQVGGGIGSGSGMDWLRWAWGGICWRRLYRATDAIQEGDVSTNAFDDFFEYALTQPVTIHKNESAMVPILQQDLPAEHVTLWSSRSHAAARGVAGEQVEADARLGQLFHLRERRVCRRGPARSDSSRRKAPAELCGRPGRAREGDGPRQQAHPASCEIRKGVIIETHMDVASVTYSATNSADVDRVVLLEHPRRQWLVAGRWVEGG